MGRNVYSKGMASNLTRLAKLHSVALSSDPSHHVAIALKNALALKSPTLEQFDNTFTCIAGGGPPDWPMQNSTDYYKFSSSHHMLPHVKVPLLAVNAHDDPIVREVPTSIGEL